LCLVLVDWQGCNFNTESVL